MPENEIVTPTFDCGDMDVNIPCPAFPQPTLRFYFDLDEWMDVRGLTTLDLNNVYWAGFYRLDTARHTYLHLPPNFTGKLILQVGGYDPIHRSLTFQVMKMWNNNNSTIRTQKLENKNIECGTGDDTEDWTEWQTIWNSENLNPGSFQPAGDYILNRGTADVVNWREGVVLIGNASVKNSTYGGALTFGTSVANLNVGLYSQGLGRFSNDVIAFYSATREDVTLKACEEIVTRTENTKNLILALINNEPTPTPKVPATTNISLYDVWSRLVNLEYNYNDLLILVQNGILKIIDIPLTYISGNIYSFRDLDLSAYPGWRWVILKCPKLSGGRGEDYDEIEIDYDRGVSDYAYRRDFKEILEHNTNASGRHLVYNIVNGKVSLMGGDGYVDMTKAGPGVVRFLLFKPQS